MSKGSAAPKKRNRGQKEDEEQDNDPSGFGSPAMKLVAGAYAQTVVLFGASFIAMEATLDSCRTLKQFKAARTAVKELAKTTMASAEVISLHMLSEGIELAKK